MSTINPDISVAPNIETHLPLYRVEKFGLGILAILLIYLIMIAIRCNVHFYDSFEYLNNAKEWVGVHTRYDINRPPFFPILLVPIAFLSKFLDSPIFFEKFPYFLMIISGFSVVLMFWWMIRISLPPHYAMLATLGLAFNALFLHYWIFLMPEVFACLLIFLFWRFVLRENYLLVGITLGALLSLRYQLAPLSIVGILYAVITQRGNWAKLIKNWAIVAIASAFVLVLFHYVSVTIGANISLIEAYNEVSARLIEQFWGVKEKRPSDSILALFGREFNYLFHFITAPVLLVSLVGMFKAFHRKGKLDWLFLLWFWGVFLAYSLVVQVAWKEARYLLVIFPPIYYFFSLGLMVVWQYLDQLLREHHFALRKGLLVVFSLSLLTAPLLTTHKELNRLWDKSYTRPVGHTLAKILKPRLSPNEPVFWAGSYYTIAPFNFYFSIPEKFFFFNLFSNGLSFYLERPCYFNYTEEFMYKNAVGSHVVLNRNLCQDCGFINNFNPLKPLTVHTLVKQTKFYATDRTIEHSVKKISTNFTVFTSESGEELYLAEAKGDLVIDKGSPQTNTVIQFILKGERLPIYPEPSFFDLPSQVPLTPKRKLANIDFILISELSEPIGKAF